MSKVVEIKKDKQVLEELLQDATQDFYAIKHVVKHGKWD